MKKPLLWLGIVSILVLLFTAACNGETEGDLSAAGEENRSETDENRSETEENTSADGTQEEEALVYELDSGKWPTVIEQYGDEAALEAYHNAIYEPEVLQYMPCYCGCYEERGHTSVKDCFVQSFEGDVAVLDAMGLGWQICIDIAREAIERYEQGVPLVEIREDIDQTYEAQGLTSTPTPEPPEEE